MYVHKVDTKIKNTQFKNALLTYLCEYLLLITASLLSGGLLSMSCSFLTTGARSSTLYPEWNCKHSVWKQK